MRVAETPARAEAVARLTAGADLALAESYRDWWTLCNAERRGDLPSHAECVAALRAIRQAERLVANPNFVYEVAKGQWWVDTGREP